MLARVEALSRPDDQAVENNDGPKGLDVPGKPVLCGIDPARNRERAPPLLPAAAVVAGRALESIPDTPVG